MRSVTDIDWLAGKSEWKDIQTILQYRSWRNGVQTDRHYISSVDKSAEEFYRSIRGHWSIENRLHWSLDMVFGEDAAHVTKDRA